LNANISLKGDVWMIVIGADMHKRSSLLWAHTGAALLDEFAGPSSGSGHRRGRHSLPGAAGALDLLGEPAWACP
jgi:hypothetical protein